MSRVIPADVRAVQLTASDPRRSAWVSANAGSGKTHVLAQRVIRLLLDGVAPEKILCITFTKAAAANMAARVFNELGEWIALDDAALAARIAAMSNVRMDGDRLMLARRLFATALDTPGGLKVQTIHAFCTRLLHQFPFEADVAARFEVLDDAATTRLLDEISLQVLLEATEAPDSANGRALALAITTVADQTFKSVIAEAIRKRDAVTRWIAAGGGVDGAIGQLCGALGVSAADTIAAVEAEIVDGPYLPLGEWRSVAAALREGSSSDSGQARRLETAAAESGAAQVEQYLDVFFTDENPRRTIATQAFQRREPHLAERLKREQERLTPLVERRRALQCRDRTAALLSIAETVIARYRTEKNRRGLLDYDDLIAKTLALLSDYGAAWVHYKLDRGIDHVLIDEAQDTSPQQWEIVQRLTDEFFAGAGARSVLRTIFAVGDEKQSIFSFQGAAPRSFDENRRAFDTLARDADRDFKAVQFAHSFRSGPSVLGAVDTVFQRPTVYPSITADAHGPPPHEALPEAAPGLVEIWEPVQPDEKPAIEPWDAPFDKQSATSPQVKLAAKIAAFIGRRLERDARPGDVLVLVRQRGALFEEIIRALKHARIAVAGADRLVLIEHIAVMDLMALGDALLLPDDDLALASALKSPLFGFDDDDLFTLAWRRPGTLRVALRNAAGANPRFAEASARLDRYAEWARSETPFAFYARLLSAERGRARILSRLGPESNDALDEFLNLALDHESRTIPSLQAFLAALRMSMTDVKRDMEITRDEVRVMTVHGAKGLEAPIVILADTMTQPAGPPQLQPRLLTLPSPHAAPGAPDCLAWAARKAQDTAPIRTARVHIGGEAEDEYRRLLYVAMTRAAEYLVICGADGRIKRPAGCWYDLVREALAAHAEEEPAEDGDGTVLRFRKGEATVRPATLAAAAATAVAALPDWLRRDAPHQPPPRIAVAPSAARVVGDAAALRRGVAAHRLLQALPEIPLEAREAAGRQYLARVRPPIAESERLLAEVLALLAMPRFAPLFQPGSHAESPIVGRLPDGTVISGQVDRLCVTPDAVLIADYKTNRAPPRTLEAAPEAYLRQLALYRAVLSRLYPDRPVRAALLWTETPDLMEIPAAAMDAALRRVTST